MRISSRIPLRYGCFFVARNKAKAAQTVDIFAVLSYNKTIDGRRVLRHDRKLTGKEISHEF